MRKVLITINPVIDMETLEVVSHDGQYWAEPEMLACGASSAEKAAANQQASFAQMLYNNYSTYFGQQSSILSDIKDTMEPVLEAGPNQTGFSSAENAALNTEAIDTNAAAAERAGGAVNAELAGRGDNSGLESGVDKQIQAGIKSKAAGSLASEQNEITEENYATGRQNFEEANNTLLNTAGQFNPSSIASEFNTGSENEFNEQSKINTENNALGSELLGGALGLASEFSYGPIGLGFGKG